MMLPLLPLLLQILFLVLVTSYGRYLVILGERRRVNGVLALTLAFKWPLQRPSHMLSSPFKVPI
jgi:hypothetical protein